MGFFRKIAGILGFVKDEAHEVNDEDNDADGHHNRGEREETRQPTRGFSVQVPVAVDKAHMGPIITPCDPSDGGVQGLRWYTKRLRIDEDGDVADEFFDELLPEVSSDRDNQRPLPSFKVKYNTHPALVKNQVLTIDGGIRQNVEFQVNHLSKLDYNSPFAATSLQSSLTIHSSLKTSRISLLQLIVLKHLCITNCSSHTLLLALTTKFKFLVPTAKLELFLALVIFCDMADLDHSSDDTSVDSQEETSQDSKLDFSEDEETLIIRMYNLIGERWSLIAGRIPGRTAEEIEKYWTSRYSTSE